MTLHGRYLLLAAAAVAVALIGGGAFLVGGLAATEAEAERERLLIDLAAAEAFLRTRAATGPFPERAAEVGELLDARVVILDREGWVLADSGIPGGDVRGLENHGDRPEIRAALEGRTEPLARHSATRGERHVYAAATLELDGRPLLLRVSRPETAAGVLLNRVIASLSGAGAAALLLLLLGFHLVDRLFRRDLSRLQSGILTMQDGRFDRLPARDDLLPELEALGGSLARLGEEFQGRLSELARERDEMQTLIDSIAEGVVALTDDARVLRMNRAAARLLEAEQPSPFAPIGALVRNPDLRDHLEASVIRDMPPREVVVGGRNLLVSSHLLETGGSVATFLDVTELRRMEKIRRDFVANASHELKTPLTSMRGFAETLLEGDPPEHLRTEFLSSIRKNTIRLQNLVDDLLDLSRLEAGAWRVEEEETEVALTAREVWKELLPHHEERELTFSVAGDGVALADGRALHQIFRNLLENAIRFTPDGGWVRVEIQGGGPMLTVSVADSGPGIPSSALPRIFERFYRVDAGRGRHAGGTGLGLAIVRHLVHSLGGEVDAESRLGEGTTIRFTLPRVEVD